MPNDNPLDNTTEIPTEKFPPPFVPDAMERRPPMTAKELDAASTAQLERCGLIPKVSLQDNAQSPKFGDKVQFRGEDFSFQSNLDKHVVLFQRDRNSQLAMNPTKVTDKELAEKYQEIKVIIDGKAQSRYIQKGNPEAGVFALVKWNSNQIVTLDHQFVVAKKADVIKEPTSSRKPDLERSTEKPKSELRAEKPAHVEAVDHKWYGKVDERTRTINGGEIKVRTPQKLGDFNQREVEINGRIIKLERDVLSKQPWYCSKPRPASIEGQQVKLHVTGMSPEDVVKLQKELLPLLDHMREKGEVRAYKTFDPNFMDSNWNNDPMRFGPSPGPELQDSKAFTIYVTADKAEQVAKIIDNLLEKKGLKLPEDHKAGTVGDKSREKSASRRVSIERDFWTVTENAHGDKGGLLDAALSKKLYEKYKSYGESEGRLTEKALQRIEQDVGLKEGQLMYDREGRLMFKSADGSMASHGMYYASESSAQRTGPHKTGRPALYALYESQGVDPVQEHLKHEIPRLADRRPQRRVPDAERLESVRQDQQQDGTVDRREHRAGEEARKLLEKREQVDKKEIEALKCECEKLENSKTESERQRGAKLRRTVEALEGKHGTKVQEQAHREMMKQSRQLLDRGEGGGYAKGVAGGLIGVGILTVAALAWYQSAQQPTDRPPLERARVRK